MRQPRQPSLPLNSGGYMLPELLAVILVTGFFVSLVVFYGFSYWRFGALLESDQDTFITRLNANDYLRENLGRGSWCDYQASYSD